MEDIKMDISEMIQSPATEIYRQEMMYALKLSFPGLTHYDIEDAVNYSIMKRGSDSRAILDNNYKKSKENTTLYTITNYLVERQPIITVAGVMFKRHGSCPNPFVALIQEFLAQRKIYKKEMFKYPKGSEDFEKYNILQLSEKVSCNAIYGASGNNTSIFYNLYVAQSITTQGRSCIAAAIMLFEATMANNVKFGSLNDIVQFINNVRREPDGKYIDEDILDKDKYVSVEECFYKMIYTCGFYWVPSEKEMTLIWDMLNQCTQHELNKLFYKNNLFWFIDNSKVMNTILDILKTLDVAFIDPNTVPENVKDMMDDLYDMIYEWVYYNKQYSDRFDRAENMYRCVSMLTDTDSCFISFDGWYRYILSKTYDIPMKIKELDINEDTGEVTEAFEKSLDYDFYKDEIIESERIIRPNIITPQVGFRCSIINILANIMGRLSIDYMQCYSDNSNSSLCADGTRRKSFFILKNEFQLKRIYITEGKKNYCAYQERQESSIIPKEKALAITGLAVKKAGTADSTKAKLQKILLEQILDRQGNISQIEIVKQLAILEKQIIQSIHDGSKEYFKPERIKAMGAYDNPLRESGVKAALVYNELRTNGMVPIDLDTRNSILNIKIDINKKNVDELQDKYPEIYEKITKLMEKKEFSKGITGIAIMPDMDVPEWVKDYIDYATIVNDNIRPFPLSALNISRFDIDEVNFTNVLAL